MVSRLVAFAALCAAVVVGGGLLWRMEAKRPQSLPSPNVYAETDWIPDDYTRSKAQNLTAQDVNFIRLKGLNTGHDGDPSQDITDPKMIEIFLDALRYSQTVSEMQTAARDKCDTFEIFFRNHDHWVVPTRFDFPLYYFGPPFQEALVKLGKYRADQLHTLLRERGGHLKKVTFGRDDKVFRTPYQVKAITAELNTLDENAFAYAKMDNVVFVHLFFDNAKTQTIYLILRNWKYHRPDETPKAWPPLLTAYLHPVKKRFKR